MICCFGLLVGGLNLCAATMPFAEHLTTQSIVVRLDGKTTETRNVLSTAGRPFLRSVLQRLPEPNKSIVDLMLQYPENGRHDYWWPRKGEGQFDGSTTDVLLNNQLVMKGEPKGRTFCCGLTLEVFYRYINMKPALAAKVLEDPATFKSDWFCREIFSPGPQDALEATGLGKQVTDPDDALPGDFVQIWRNDKSGHSVMFVNWLWNGTGEIIGLQYWSTQTATEGIGFNSEIFGTSPKQVSRKNVSVSRPEVIN